MKRVFGRFGRLILESKHTPNAIMALSSVIISSYIVLTGYGLSPHSPQPTTVTATDQYITLTPDTPVNDAVANSSTGQPSQAIAAVNPAATSQKQLDISPAAVSIRAGESFSGLTITTDDNTAVNMPAFSAGAVNGLLLNFTASPAKTAWTGNISVAKSTLPGTYSFEISAQANRTTTYTNTITVTVVPTPTVILSLLPVGYDYTTDSLVYVLRLNRLNGYDQPVTRLTGQSSADPLTLTCTFQATDTNTYTVTCGNNSGTRPTTGTLQVNVSTASDVFSSSASFSLPPL